MEQVNATHAWAIADGWWPAVASVSPHDMAAARGPFAAQAPEFQMVNDRMARIQLAGPMVKGMAWGGAVSTTGLQMALHSAMQAPEVKGILFHVDSPGGMVAGTMELARMVASANAQKPIVVHAEDTMASAAYWATAGASKIFASKGTLVGSIGVMVPVDDTSRMGEMMGVKRYMVTSGGVKGAGSDFVPVNQDELDSVQAIVDDYFNYFVEAVATGRGISAKRARELGDGRVHMSEKAQELGLIDGVQTIQDSYAALDRLIRNREAKGRAASLTGRK